MWNAWRRRVAPFVPLREERLALTLWLTGSLLPTRISLRTERGNEEIHLPMTRLKRAPQPGVSAWQVTLAIHDGQPRRRYSFKLLWPDRQRWFTPQGFSDFPPARLEQFAVDVPDYGPQWVTDRIFYQIFPDRFARSEPRRPEQDTGYWPAAARHSPQPW